MFYQITKPSSKCYRFGVHGRLARIFLEDLVSGVLELFSQLRDVRIWGVRDRLHETGVLDDWKERVEHNAELIPCEIELWFRADHRRRRAARESCRCYCSISTRCRFSTKPLLRKSGTTRYLPSYPLGSVSPLLMPKAGQESSLVQCEQIQFIRASGQMAGIVFEDERTTDARAITNATAHSLWANQLWPYSMVFRSKAIVDCQIDSRR